MPTPKKTTRDWDEFRYRELQRIALEIQGTQLEHNLEILDRLEQLNSGFIFYPKRFFSSLWYHLRYLVILKCPMCHTRHLRTYTRVLSPRHSYTCCYGWGRYIKILLPLAWFAGQNGDD